MSKIREFLCKIHFCTSLFHDSALITSAERCNYCGRATDHIEGMVQDRERQLVSEARERGEGIDYLEIQLQLLTFRQELTEKRSPALGAF